MSNFKREKTELKPTSGEFTRINKTGCYTGHFTKAYELKSKSSSSVAMHLEFTSVNGESAVIDLWHTGRNGNNLDKNGNKSTGYVNVIELMTVLDIDELKSKQAPVQMWDRELKQNVVNVVNAYPQLIEKQVGILVQAVKNAKQENVNGAWRTTYPLQYFDNVELVKFFNSDTNKTAYETENNLPGIEIEKILKKLPDVKWPKETHEEDKIIEEKANTQQKTQVYSESDFDPSSIPF